MAKEQAGDRPDRQAKDRTDTGAPDDESLHCAACDHRITERAYRSERAGAHEHAFVNPAGFQFRIGCFVAAPGCAHAGPTSDAFSWFPGWRWQLALCGRCHGHVGWIYRLGAEQFHGLILAALK